MPKSLLLLPFLALSAIAQQRDPGKIPPMTFPAPKLSLSPVPSMKLSQTVRQAVGGCPVSISATPQGTPRSLWVSSAQDAALPAMRGGTGVYVRLASLFQQISKLTVEVSYRVYDGVYPVTTVLPREQSKTFELTLAGAQAIERNLRVAPHAEVTGVRVLTVVYADGSEWQTEFSGLCHVKPSRMVLASSH